MVCLHSRRCNNSLYNTAFTTYSCAVTILRDVFIPTMETITFGQLELGIHLLELHDDRCHALFGN